LLLLLWMTPTNIEFDVCACDPKGWPSAIKGDPAFGCCENDSKCGWLYSSIEGGPGYWSGSQLPTSTMKWRLVITTACYENGGQTPLFFYGGKVMECKHTGVIQLSNRMLLSPDGITFSRQGLYGVGFVRTPIGKTHDGDVRNFWTFVVDADNFAGPVAYLLPEMFKERPAKWRVQSAHLKDYGSPGVGMSTGGGWGFEWNTLFALKQESETDSFIKIPQMAVPVKAGTAVLATKGRSYENKDVYEPLEQVLSNQKSLNSDDIMTGGTAFSCSNSEGIASFRLSEKDTVSVGSLQTTKTSDGCEWLMTTKNKSGFFPNYFKSPKAGQQTINPVDGSAVPKELREADFPKKGTLWSFNGPYDAMSSPPAGGCLSNPGPADPALYCVKTVSPSWVGYRWYRFIDQPGLQRLGLSDSEKTFLQRRVELLHKSLTGKDRWIKGQGVTDLVEIDGAQLVTPPAQKKHGYVPIVVYEGVEKPKDCTHVV